MKLNWGIIIMNRIFTLSPLFSMHMFHILFYIWYMLYFYGLGLYNENMNRNGVNISLFLDFSSKPYRVVIAKLYICISWMCTLALTAWITNAAGVLFVVPFFKSENAFTFRCTFHPVRLLLDGLPYVCAWRHHCVTHRNFRNLRSMQSIIEPCVLSVFSSPIGAKQIHVSPHPFFRKNLIQ